MNAVTPPCFLFFLTLSGFPVLASLPNPNPVPQHLLDYLDSSEQFNDLKSRYIAYLQQQGTPEVDGNVLQEADEDGGNVLQEADEDGGTSDRDVARQTKKLQDILKLIYQRILDVQKRRQELLKRRRLYESIKRGPTNHFLRIGKRGMDTEHTIDVFDPSDVNRVSAGLFDYPLTSNDVTEGLSVQERSGDDAFTLLEDYSDEKPAEQRHVAETDDFTVSRRSLPFPNSFLRTGSDNFDSILKRFLPERNNFVRIGRNGDGETGSSHSPLETPLPIARRSYVRIGRLPASVFRQRQRQSPAGAGSGDALAGRRSSGYRLTKSGIVRAGKRSSGGESFQDVLWHD